MAAIISVGAQSTPPADDPVRAFISPLAVDQMIRQAIATCWMLLPKERRNVGEVRTHILRIMERALSNMEEDFLLVEGGDAKSRKSDAEPT
jgi:hypothetical protein